VTGDAVNNAIDPPWQLSFNPRNYQAIVLLDAVGVISNIYNRQTTNYLWGIIKSIRKKTETTQSGTGGFQI
jgi:hypothetical protein